MSYQDFRGRDGRTWLPRNLCPAAARERRRGSCVCLAVAPANGSFTNSVRGQVPWGGHSTPSHAIRPKGPRSPVHSHWKSMMLLTFQPSLDLSSAQLSAIRTQRQMSPIGQTENRHCRLILPHVHALTLDSECPSLGGESFMTVSALSTSQVQALPCADQTCRIDGLSSSPIESSAPVHAH